MKKKYLERLTLVFYVKNWKQIHDFKTIIVKTSLRFSDFQQYCNKGRGPLSGRNLFFTFRSSEQDFVFVGDCLVKCVL